MRRVKLGLAFLTCAQLVASYACNRDPPSFGSGGSGGSRLTCGVPPLANDSACAACLDSKCCAEMTTCVGSQKCLFCSGWLQSKPYCADEPTLAQVTELAACQREQCGDVCPYDDLLAERVAGPLGRFCRAVAGPFCEALFTCCTDEGTLHGFGGDVDTCKDLMKGASCLDMFDVPSGIDGLRELLHDGQVKFDESQLDACVKGLAPLAAASSACTTAPLFFFAENCLTAFKGQVPLGAACKWGHSFFSLRDHSFIPCKEGRCEDGLCVPFRKLGESCDAYYGPSEERACDYLHDQDCNVSLGGNDWACGPIGDIGDPCTDAPRSCKSGYCDDVTHACVPGSGDQACFGYAVIFAK